MSGGERSPVDVIVIGAGIAGLTAAVTAQQQGLRAVVLEARSRVGGRVHSLLTKNGTVDLGATWFWHNEPMTASLCEQLDIATFEQYVDGDGLFEPVGQVPQRLQGNPIDAPALRFTGGAGQLARRLGGLLAPGSLHLATPVSAIVVTDSGVQARTGSDTFEAQNVVLAVPPALAVEQIRFTPELPQDVWDVAARTSVWMGDMVKAVAIFDRAFWRDEHLAGSAVSYVGPFRELHDHSGPEGAPAALFGFAPVARFAGSTTPEVVDAFTAQLSRLFGADSPAPGEVQVVDWRSERYTAPAVAHPEASSANYGHAVFQQSVHERVRWASTETATAFAGHIEGGIRAGAAAVRSLTG